MTTVAEFLGAAPASRSERPLGPGEDGSWHFELGKDVHGAFGGVFGGAVAAACVTAARPAAPGRRSFSLHVTFVRALATPTCDARVEVVNAGRTITTVAVDLHDADAKLAARSTVTFAAPEALSPQDHAGRVGVPEFAPVADGTPIRMAGAGNPPIVEVMEPRMVGRRLLRWGPGRSGAGAVRAHAQP
ncbi:MAG: thioesterase family protein [Actinobacteria bacterium]|nr:thioesterase family protein [Actinomycetota bacterium]